MTCIMKDEDVRDFLYAVVAYPVLIIAILWLASLLS